MASAAQITNPLGAQTLFDGGVPRTFTAHAREVISGGDLVQISGATGDVGSQVSSYADSDLQVIGAQNVKLCNGIALFNAASGARVTIATRGAYLCLAGGIVSGGALVMHNASGAVANWTPLGDSGTQYEGVMGIGPIGRAMTTSASGTANFALVHINV